MRFEHVFRRLLWLLAIGVLAIEVLTATCQAQIPQGPLTVRIVDFATVPDSSGQPARMMAMTADPLGRLFVNDQRGPLHLYNGTSETFTEYLDLRDFATNPVTSSSEQGFQGFTFHPDFNNVGQSGFGKFYTIHSTSNRTPAPTYPFSSNSGSTSFNTHDTVLLEWSVTDPTASTYTAAGGIAPREVFRLEQPRTNHNSGLVAFNTSIDSAHADYGNLYVAIGDGGSGDDPWEIAEDPSNPYGTILRIDPLGNDGANGQYGIVSDNFFATDGDAGTLAEIYTYGLRNPQRFGWDNATGNMFIADIGQDVWEEINLGVNGGNYGWDHREGSTHQNEGALNSFLDPIAEYSHFGALVENQPAGLIGNRAVTVGEVVRGSGIPGLDGTLLLGDFPTGMIFYMNAESDPFDGGDDGLFELTMLDENDNPVRLRDLFITVSGRVDLRFSYGIDGEVYILNKHDGVVRQLAVVPEPATYVLALIGVAACAWIYRRHRQR